MWLYRPGGRRASARRTENGGSGIFFFSAIRAAPEPETAARGDAPGQTHLKKSLFPDRSENEQKGVKPPLLRRSEAQADGWCRENPKN